MGVFGKRWSESDLKVAEKTGGTKTIKAADFMGNKPSESEIQRSLIKALALIKHGGRPLIDFIYAIPNGGHRAKSTAKQMQLEGVKKGVPDLHCIVAVAPYHSLYIEMKTPKGDLSSDQKAFVPLLRECGHKVVVCRSVDQALTEIQKYLGGSHG